MGDINLSGSRPKSTTTNPLAPGINTPAAVANDTTKQLVQRIEYENLTPNPTSITVSDCSSDGSATITTTGNFLTSGIKPGDQLDGAGSPVEVAGLTVLSVESATSLTASGAPTGAFGPAAIEFDLPIFGALLMAVRWTFTMTESNVTIRQETFVLDGSTAVDSNGNGEDDVDLSNERAVDDKTYKITLDDYLANARVAQSA